MADHGFSHSREDRRRLIAGRGHVAALDGVRGAAILLVFMVHFRLRIGASALDLFVDKFLRSGWVGVDLFFVLSGMLITGILLDTKSGPDYFRNFYLRRALRLFPAYYITLAVLFILLPRILNPVPEDLAALVPFQAWYWTYTVNVFQALTSDKMVYFNTLHLWSLAVEEQFYVVWPLVVRAVSARTLLRLCAVAVPIALVFRWVVMDWNTWAAYSLTPGRMDALAIGGSIAVLARNTAGSNFIRRWWPSIGILAMVGILVIALARHQYREDDVAVITAGFLFNALASGALIAGILARPGSRLLRPFHWRWLQWVGRVSYGAYLFHLLLLIPAAPVKTFFRTLPPILGSQLPAQMLWFLFMSGLTLTVAAASYRWLETPFLQAKERFAKVARKPRFVEQRRTVQAT